jgi:hypothetical protein
MMFEVLAGLPAYGPLPKLISQTGSPVYREGFVVRFLPGVEGEWVGNFQPGLGSFDDVCVHPDGKHVFVIAGGAAYVIDPVTQTVIQSFGGQFESCILFPDGRGLLLSNCLSLTLIRPQGTAWQTHRLAWYGLRVHRVSEDEVLGEGRHFDDSWHAFSVRLSDGQASGGAYDGP